MKLVTFNIRYMNPEDGENFQPLRRPFIARKVLAERPLAVGWQEMDTGSFEAMRALLPGYGWFGTGNSANRDGEGNFIAYDLFQAELLEGGQEWLSPTPHVPGSRYPGQSDCPRAAVWVRLREKAAGKCFYLLNTHLDHISHDAIQRGLEASLALAARLPGEDGLPLFYMGDLNFQPTEAHYVTLVASGMTDLTFGIPVTFHDFGRLDHDDKSDYILTTAPVGCVISLWKDRDETGRWLSDHYPVSADIAW